MSDLSIPLEAKHRAATPPRLQLPVSSYFDEALFREEQRLIFDDGPRYVGHALAVPEVGDFHVLQHEGNGRALVRGPGGVQLVSNICRHRQAVMLQGRGNTGGQVVCPLHRWTYGLDGQLKGAPHFQQDPCLHLRNYPLQQWNGLLFEAGGRAVAEELRHLGTAGELDFTGYVFDRAVVHDCAYNWKTFIEVYLEDYHVGPFHPGLGNLVTCDDLRWEFGAQYSVQTVGLKPRLDRPGSPVYARYHDALQRWQNGQTPAQGAIWLTLYPGVMVEWYPGVLTVSTLHAVSPLQTVNVVEFYYPEEVALFERELVEAQQAAYMETCAEDDEIALRMDAGRRALMQRGDDEAGPYQSPMEDGMQHFHAWYRRAMGTAAP